MGSRNTGLLAGLLALIVAVPAKVIAAPAPAPTSTNLVMAAGTNSLASGATISAGTVVTFVVSVSAAGTKLTQGQMMLCDPAATSCTDIHQFGTAQLTSAGTARFRFVPGIGSHNYKAVFAGTPSGSPPYSASSSAAVTLTVTGRRAAQTTTAITQVGSNGHYSMTATVSGIVNRPGLAAPTGAVSFLDTTDANAVLGTSTLGSAVTSGLIFSPASHPPSTMAGSPVVTADFNGDGFADVVVGNPFSNGLKILPGKGDGSFGPPVSTAMPDSYMGPNAVADFNGDGIPDLAVWTNSNTYNVTILLGRGDGTFSIVSHLDQITSQGMVTGDFNGDGIADLATAEGYAVTVYFGKGDGTFSAGSKNSWLPQVNPLYLAAGDFNGDGLTDLAVTDTAVPGSVFLLLSNGDGTFSKTGLTPATGFFVGAIAAGDLNGDGLLDLALANDNADSTHGMTILLGNGDGTFQAPVSYSAPTAFRRSLAIVDINGDGIPDLATEPQDPPSSLLAILPGKGDGTFDTLMSLGFPSAYFTASTLPADFDGDGIPDLVVTDATGNLNLLLTEPVQSVTATVPDAVLPAGTHQVVATYAGDSLFLPSVSPASSVSWLLAPTLTVTPSATNFKTPQDLTVIVAVGGVQGYPTPTGPVTLSTVAYTSGPVALNNGRASIQMPAAALLAGTDILTADYQPDVASQTIYGSQIGFATVVVTSPSVAAPPQFSVPPGTYSTPQIVSFTETTPNSTIYYTLDGSDPTTGSAVYSTPLLVTSTETVKAFATAAGYTPSPISIASYTIAVGPAPVPLLINLSPAFTSAGSQGFTLTVNGSGFTAGSVILLGTTPLATQVVSGNQLVAQVPASDTATAGTIPITVQTSAPGGVVSNALQFEIDSAAASSGSAPVFSTAAATISAGSTATYPVVMPSAATNISATCLNLPSGATCGYSAATGAVTITSLSTTPAGAYTVTVVFTETEPGAVTAAVLMPLLLLPFTSWRKKTPSKPLWRTALFGTLLLIAGACVIACGGNSASTQTPPPSNASHQVISSATVSLTIH